MKQYSSLLRLLILYAIGIIAVTFILIWSVMAAWFVLLGFTSIVFLLVFLKISPAILGTSMSEQRRLEAPVTKRMRELEGSVEMGFAQKNIRSQRKVFESLASGFAGKVRGRLEMDDDEFKEFLVSPERLSTTVGDPQLVQLLIGNLKPDMNNWSIKRFGELISLVEDWGQ